MAKVKGPLMSMEASGAYGGTLVFGRRLGANVVRQLVKPANPRSAGQQVARNRVRVFGALQSFLNNTSLKLDGQSETDKDRLAAITPSGQRWNSYLQQVGTGAGGVAFTAAEAAYSALDATAQGDWDTAAAALSPQLNEVAQRGEGGSSEPSKTAGEVFFILQYALSQAGLNPMPTATPPTYS